MKNKKLGIIKSFLLFVIVVGIIYSLGVFSIGEIINETFGKILIIGILIIVIFMVLQGKDIKPFYFLKMFQVDYSRNKIILLLLSFLYTLALYYNIQPWNIELIILFPFVNLLLYYSIFYHLYF